MKANVLARDDAQNHLMLYTDGVNNDYHDVDYYEGNYGTNWYGGLAHWYTASQLATGCMNRGDGWVQINNAWGYGNAQWNSYITHHETGHEIGLAHVYSCTAVMNPSNCGYDAISACDAFGAYQLYP